MDLFSSIDTRSFSNIWYWIILTTLWSSLSYWTLGIPYSIIWRAKSRQPQAQEDLLTLLHIKARRYAMKDETERLIRNSFLFFSLSILFTTALIYNAEFSQAILLLYLPVLVVSQLSSKGLRAFIDGNFDSDRSCKMLTRLRLYTQIIGMLAIFVSAFWGILHNLLAKGASGIISPF